MNLEIERLVDLASSVPLSKRAELLARECPDPRIRSEVESLLEYVTGAEAYFEQAIRGVASMLRTSGDPAPGDTFGVYRIVSLLGRGGMGSVFLAERADGELEQKVAIKLLRADCLRPMWRERFLTERQLLASLQHPSILHVVDAGHTEDGRPFLITEHVDGEPIDVYAAKLDIRSRLRLFLRVCEGVSHAHRRLIIHRDLKPSNILVDASGLPKVLDFGIAKLLDETADGSQTVEQLLTPDYASPEQIAGEAQTTSTDIYSLGVVLHKLLTGHLPLQSANAAEPVVVGQWKDLDFIVRKALRPEPDDRYHSVDDMASDIRAALEWRPVSARAGDRWYRSRRFVRRYWVPVLAALLVIASLTIGLLLVNRERAIAEHRFTEVRRLSNTLFDIDTQVAQLPGGSKTRELIVSTALEYLKRMSVGAESDPSLALDLATAYMRAGRVQGVNIASNLGRTVQADEAEAKAEALIGWVLERQPRNRTALLRAAQIQHDRMALAGDARNPAAALRFANNAAARIDQYLALEPLNGRSDRLEAQQVVITLINVANRYVLAGQFDPAIRMSRRAAEIATVTNWPAQAGASLIIVAMAQRERGELEAALETIRESVRVLQPAPDEKGMGRYRTYGLALMREGQILGEDQGLNLGRPDEAVDVTEKALAMAEEFARLDAADFASQYRIYICNLRLADIVRHTDAQRAIQLYDQAMQRLSRLSANSETPLNEVRVLAASSGPLLQLGRTADARHRLDTAIARLRGLNLYPADHIQLGEPVDETLRAVAELEAATGQVREGAARYRDLLSRVDSEPNTLNDSLQLSTLLQAAARLEMRAGDAAQSAALQARRLELWQRWSKTLPGNAYVQRQLEAARLE